MSRKRIRSQKPLGSGVSAMTKSRAMRKPRRTLLRKHRVVAALALVTMLIAATAILAQRGKQKTLPVQNPAEQVQNLSQLAGAVSPASLTSPSLWSKEYIHGPGGRIIATQDRVVFTDVDEVSEFSDDIYRIAARGVTLGCSTTQYCPNDTVLRDQMAVFIERAIGVFSPPTPTMQHFTDVPPGYWAYAFIEDFATRNITDGCTPTTYCPVGQVTHEQMAKFIIRARGEFNPPWPTQQRFNDVPIDHSNPFANFIDRMALLGIWQGCGSNNYCPAAPVTRRQMAHILVKAFGI